MNEVFWGRAVDALEDIKKEEEKMTLDKLNQQLRLEEQIEFHIQNVLVCPEDSKTYKTGEKMIRELALEYKKLTGEYYRREWN